LDYAAQKGEGIFGRKRLDRQAGHLINSGRRMTRKYLNQAPPLHAWHCRLGHFNEDNIDRLAKESAGDIFMDEGGKY